MKEKTSSAFKEVSQTFSDLSINDLVSPFSSDYTSLRLMAPRIYSLFTNSQIVTDSELVSSLNNLSQKYPGTHFIINLSGRQISSEHVVSFDCSRTPTIPLSMCLTIIRTMHRWLASDPENVIIIALQSNLQRACLLSVGYLYLSCSHQSPQLINGQSEVKKEIINNDSEKSCLQILEDLSTLNKKYLSKSHLRFFTYIEKLRSKNFPSNDHLLIRRVSIVNCPLTSENTICPFLEIFSDGHLEFTSFTSSPPEYRPDDTLISFDVNAPPKLRGDLLIRVRDFDKKSKSKITILKAAIHTGYVEKEYAEEDVDFLKNHFIVREGFKVQLECDYSPLSEREAAAALDWAKMSDLKNAEEAMTENLEIEGVIDSYFEQLNSGGAEREDAGKKGESVGALDEGTGEGEKIDEEEGGESKEGKEVKREKK